MLSCLQQAPIANLANMAWWAGRMSAITHTLTHIANVLIFTQAYPHISNARHTIANTRKESKT